MGPYFFDTHVLLGPPTLVGLEVILQSEAGGCYHTLSDTHTL